jgi:hypothetical protein
MILQHDKVGLSSNDGEPGPACDRDGERPRITVVYTTIEGTFAALDAAVRLSIGLEAQIVLLVAEEVAIYYPLNHAPVATRFFQSICGAILQELEINESSVKLEIFFCRRQVQCFEATLEPRSIVVLGTKNQWWHWRERRLARTLKLLGHDAVLVTSRGKGSRCRSVVQRLLNDRSKRV